MSDEPTLWRARLLGSTLDHWWWSGSNFGGFRPAVEDLRADFDAGDVADDLEAAARALDAAMDRAADVLRTLDRCAAGDASDEKVSAAITEWRGVTGSPTPEVKA